MRALLAAIAGLVLLAGCSGTAPGGGPVTVPASIGPDRTVSPVVGGTRTAIADALGARSIILEDRQAPVRPAEGPILTYAPRTAYQAQLPADPDAGIIVVYELDDAAAARAAAEDQAAYLASGPGRIQYPDPARHILRVLGSTVIFYTWIPEAAEDPLTPEVAAALATIGSGVDIPR
ncbi:MAG: hypothetical protein ACLGIJ_12500 [Candidatus Limnocylindria bacterium]